MGLTGAVNRPEPRKTLSLSRGARLADPLFRWTLTGLAALVLAILAFFFLFLFDQARPVFEQEGVFGFVFQNDWNPSQGIFQAWALVAGTLISSAIALVIGVPIAVATAIYIAEFAPRRVMTPLTILVELLAAVPSVVYGLWGVFVLIPGLMGFQQWLADTLSFVPYFGGVVAGPSYFMAGLILAIMILPIVCAISREVIETVPSENKEAALALGATRWEMVKIAIWPYSRAGIVGASMLGLGRALGETIAVTLVIGNSPFLGESIFDQGYTLASVIANEFGEAAGNAVQTGALIAAGLVLFLVTILVNGIARGLVIRSENRRFKYETGSKREVEGELMP